jgi:ketosteroid isomerase-like protein
MTEHPNAAVMRTLYEAVAHGDLTTFAGLLDPDITWHESTPGFEGEYDGSDAALAVLGRIFEETGILVSDLSIHHVLADDRFAVVHLETTVAIGDRGFIGEYVDVYRLRDGLVTAHWHLAVDPVADAKFFAG